MVVVYKLVGFDRTTDQISSAYDIPLSDVDQAKRIAGIADRPEIFADWPLSTDQAAKIADVIGERVDLAHQDFSLEPYHS